jgi:hypothetical protein
MKIGTFNLLTTSLLSSILVSNNLSCQNNNSDSLICLEIKGKVSNVGSKSGDSYKTELIYYNQVISKDDVSVNKSFKYNLKKDAIYTIRISKSGYITKLISIYTKLPEKHDELYRLDFETELLEERRAKNLNSDALDFPITIIYFNDDANWFYFNEEYTSNIKRCIYDVKVVRNKL